MITNLFKRDGKIKIMSFFLKKNVLKQIQENESEIKEINNFLSRDECNDFVEYFFGKDRMWKTPEMLLAKDIMKRNLGK